MKGKRGGTQQTESAETEPYSVRAHKRRAYPLLKLKCRGSTGLLFSSKSRHFTGHEIKSGPLSRHQLTQTDFFSDRKPAISQMEPREQGDAPHRSPSYQGSSQPVLILALRGQDNQQCLETVSGPQRCRLTTNQWVGAQSRLDMPLMHACLLERLLSAESHSGVREIMPRPGSNRGPDRTLPMGPP